MALHAGGAGVDVLLLRLTLKLNAAGQDGGGLWMRQASHTHTGSSGAVVLRDLALLQNTAGSRGGGPSGLLYRPL